MPRLRQRIVYCDCFDCADRPAESTLTPEQLDAATAVARQEPPPKALLIFVTGMLLAADGSTNLDVHTLPHCNLLVREGNLGLLATRGGGDHSAGLTPAISELSQLLGVYPEVARQPPTAAEDQEAVEAEAGSSSLPSLASRYKGMQAALASTSAPARALARRLGMAVPQRLCLGRSAAAEVGAGAGAAGGHEATAAKRPAPLALPEAVPFAAAMAEELGAAEGSSGRDLLLLHVDLEDLVAAAAEGAGTEAGAAAGAGGDAGAAAEARWEAAGEALEWLDALVKALLGIREIRERTLLTLVVSPSGRPMPAAAAAGQQLASSATAAPPAALLLPGGAAAPPIDPAAAVLTPHNPAQLGRSAGAALAAAAASVSAAAAAASGANTAAGGLAILDATLDSDVAAGGLGSGAAAASAARDAASFPLVSRPLQSFEFLGLERLTGPGGCGVDLAAPLLVVRRLPGVVRRDRAERLSYRDALAAGGLGCVQLERLLPEVAYKVARAPKYGA
ncbi:hypothetical protein CHLRE_06g285850v5 [Chlamydomonas reinhardtii]|uniref:Uncharacterized protein n=1 Tax=Chlamydomonas reinhardtii TaxID=3055 RepID=A0A2K3DPY4_CHLRE|nr:uncharacterized protein CHLRE_06g285850v5 [Chlamydomonas reinhardtii]PNW82605.1 hypothetical protein CHLRE_06g285850v5 [Chlamydomonas reinhardtii]